MKCFNLLVFFWRSLKFAVFFLDYNLRRYYLVRSIRVDKILSILLILRLAAYDWWRPLALLSRRLHSLASLSWSTSDSRSSKCESFVYCLWSLFAECRRSGAESLQSSPRSLLNLSANMLTKSGLVCQTRGLVPRSGPSWLWVPYQTENALLVSTRLGLVRRWALTYGAGTNGTSFYRSVLRPCAQLRLD